MHYTVQDADHQSLWVDLDSTKILGGRYKAPQGAPTRGLKLKNVEAMKKFQVHLVEYCKQYRI